jgi:predicted amidohydrolase
MHEAPSPNHSRHQFNAMIMKKRINLYAGCFLMLLLLSAACKDKKPSEASQTPWQFNAQRPEIAPAQWVDQEVLFEGKPTLAMSGDGNYYANGNWALDVEVTPGSTYEFQTFFKPLSVDLQNRSILARIDWRGQDGKRISQPEYPATLREKTDDGWNIIRQRYKVPEDATTARLELIFRWDAEGTVHFSEAILKEVQEIPSRMATLATVHYHPQNSGSSRENLEHFSKYISMAAENQSDIVCLPEAITMAGTGKTYIEVSEPIPGPSTEFLGNLARQHRMYIVAGLLERDGPVVYNTAVLIDREGKLAGRYRKVALPREEIEGGVTPGDSYPVFDTDFGRIGMMICWDLEFPEVARQLAMQGAEVILMPIWGGNLTLASARAIENQVWLVSSSYNMKTGVFDLEGKLVAEASEQDPVAVVQVDLNRHLYWPWLGDLKNRIPREKPSW